MEHSPDDPAYLLVEGASVFICAFYIYLYVFPLIISGLINSIINYISPFLITSIVLLCYFTIVLYGTIQYSMILYGTVSGLVINGIES